MIKRQLDWGFATMISILFSKTKPSMTHRSEKKTQTTKKKSNPFCRHFDVNDHDDDSHHHNDDDRLRFRSSNTDHSTTTDTEWSIHHSTTKKRRGGGGTSSSSSQHQNRRQQQCSNESSSTTIKSSSTTVLFNNNDRCIFQTDFHLIINKFTFKDTHIFILNRTFNCQKSKTL